MSSADPNADPSAVTPPGPRCQFLRSKGMYVYTDETDDDLEADADYDNTIFWCQMTMKDIGPDDDLVGRHECRNTLRSCYESM
jgi:hypothetical protein